MLLKQNKRLSCSCHFGGLFHLGCSSCDGLVLTRQPELKLNKRFSSELIILSIKVQTCVTFSLYVMLERWMFLHPITCFTVALIFLLTSVSDGWRGHEAVQRSDSAPQQHQLSSPLPFFTPEPPATCIHKAGSRFLPGRFSSFSFVFRLFILNIFI